MRLFAVLSLAAVLAVPAVCTWADDVAATGPSTATAPAEEKIDLEVADKEIKEKITKGIELLEAEKYAEAVKLLAGPLTKQWEERGEFGKIVEEFKTENATKLLKAMKAAKDMKPKLQRNVVVYEVEEKPKMLRFSKMEGQWVLR